MTQEVAYESLPFAIRAELHESAGDHIEASNVDLERNLDLLAHHYWLSHNDDKKRRYLRLAGEAAQAKYANHAATDYLERLVPLLEEPDRPDVLLRLGNVLGLVAEWERAQATYEEALALSRDAGDVAGQAWAETYLGDLNRVRGEFDASATWLDRAESGFEATSDDVGRGRVLQIAGTLAAMRGDFETAGTKWQSSLEIRRRLGDKPNEGELVNNLAVMTFHMGDYEGACELYEMAVALQREVGDKRRIALTLMNLGNVLDKLGETDRAGEILEESLALWYEVGERFGLWMTLGNLGNVRRAQGRIESAAALLGEGLRIARDTGERSPYLADLLENIAILGGRAGHHEVSVKLDEAAIAFRNEIGAPRGSGDEEEIASALAESRTAVGVDESELREQGKRLDVSEATALAFALCEELADG